MLVVVVNVGTLGDVRPFVAMAKGLQRAGHRVRLVTHAGYEDLAAQHGLEFRGLSGDIAAMLRTDKGQSWLGSGKNPLTFARSLRRWIEPMIDRLLMDLWVACHDAGALLFGTQAFAAYSIAERLQIPAAVLPTVPITRTREFPYLLFPTWMRAWPRLNVLSYQLAESAMWLPLCHRINAWRRRTLGLPSLGWDSPFTALLTRGVLHLYGFSPSVVPKPSDWPDFAHVCGYWMLDTPHWRPPDSLMRFLDAGSAPIYIGFGSMTSERASGTTTAIVGALRDLGQRAIVARGWGGLTTTTDANAFVVDEVPHDWLFPRVSLAVHHAGTYTAAASIRAGIPAVTIPHVGSQFFWANRLGALGVATSPIAYRELTRKRLSAAMARALEPDMRTRAARLGAAVRQEDGVSLATDLLKKLF